MYFIDETVILVCDKLPEYSHDNYLEELGISLDALEEYIGGLHGPNALKIFGQSIVKCETHVDRSPDGYTAVTVSYSTPVRSSSLSPDGVTKNICDYWSKLPVGSQEHYVI